jgi:subtilase family serine protease
MSLTQGRVIRRIVGPVQERSLSVVRGNLHPLARPELDRGPLNSRQPIPRIKMVFTRTAEQDAALNTLLQEQQDPSSPNYHAWLTPEEFADRFGLDPTDVDTVVSWLQSQGFTIDEVARSRSWVTFSGTAGQVNTALHTQLHEYAVNGQRNYAAALEPSVPAAIRNVVSGFGSLHNFRMKPRVKSLKANFTSNITGNHFLVPTDVATIYDAGTLYNNGINGTGQKIAVMGQTNILLSDIATFQSNSGLPNNPPTVILVPGSGNPGISSNDLPEADLDLEWSSAIAPKASIIYVNSGNGAFDSLQYAVDQNLAPVISISYGDCEPNFSTSDFNFFTALGKQANAQGITIVAPSGDAGAADCDGDFPGRMVAELGLAVDVPASLPYATGVGGTTLFDVRGTYWSPSNNAQNGSALSYIPEVPWNDTLIFATQGLVAGGGGRSANFAKPSWQTGPGVAKDGTRDVPDISFPASSYDGYLICSGGSCVSGFRASDSTLFAVSGTSVGAPIFAGVVALLNQRMGTPQGNVNAGLYTLAESSPTAFHDITSGGNWMPCLARSPNCSSGGLLGYSAGKGYDMVTGLGSIDIFKVVNSWPLP